MKKFLLVYATVDHPGCEDFTMIQDYDTQDELNQDLNRLMKDYNGRVLIRFSGELRCQIKFTQVIENCDMIWKSEKTLKNVY